MHRTVLGLLVFSWVAAAGQAASPAYLSRSVVYEGRDAAQVAVDGRTVYVLKKDGSIWERRDGTWGRVYESFVYKEALRIAASDGLLYASQRDKGDFSMVVRVDGRWSQFASGSAQEMVAARSRLFYRDIHGFAHIYADGKVHAYNQMWDSLIGLASDGGSLHVLKAGGVLWSGMAVIAHGIWCVTASDGILYAVQERKEWFRRKSYLMRYQDDRWTDVTLATGARTLRASAGRVYLLMEDRTVWSTDGGPLVPVDAEKDTAQIEVSSGSLVLLKTDGNVVMASIPGGSLRAETRSANFQRLK